MRGETSATAGVYRGKYAFWREDVERAQMPVQIPTSPT